MRLILSFAAFLVATTAVADPLVDKLCILSSAQKLIQVPGMVITSSKASPQDKDAAVESIVGRLPTVSSAKDLVDWFDIYDRMLNELIANSSTYLSNSTADLLKSELKSKVSGAARVEISINAASQEATFAFYCIYKSSGFNYAKPIGLVK